MNILGNKSVVYCSKEKSCTVHLSFVKFHYVFIMALITNYKKKTFTHTK